jgi:hypothetical protein
MDILTAIHRRLTRLEAITAEMKTRHRDRAAFLRGKMLALAFRTLSDAEMKVVTRQIALWESNGAGPTVDLREMLKDNLPIFEKIQAARERDPEIQTLKAELDLLEQAQGDAK